MHEKCSNLTDVPWSRGTGASFFHVHRMGVTRNLQAVRYIFSFYSCDKKCETHVLLFMSISYEHKDVSDLSMLVFCFRGHTFVVYLQTTKVHNNSVFKELTHHSTLSTPEIPPVEFPYAFGFPIVNTPPMPSKFHNREPPSPSEILKAVLGIVWIFSGIAHSTHACWI